MVTKFYNFSAFKAALLGYKLPSFYELRSYTLYYPPTLLWNYRLF